MSNSIMWSKWNSIEGMYPGQLEYTPEEDVQNYDNDDSTIFDDTEEVESDASNPIPVIMTPMGVLPLRAFNDPTKRFNFWLGDTNFDITEEVESVIDSTVGVEILDIFTRYKFRIAVGNHFKFQDVRQAIEANLNISIKKSDKHSAVDMVLDKETRVKINQIIKDQLSGFPFWAIYVCPNGQMDITAIHKNQSEFNTKVDIYRNAKRLAGGVIVRHDEEF